MDFFNYLLLLLLEVLFLDHNDSNLELLYDSALFFIYTFILLREEKPEGMTRVMLLL